jgi:hypothetical protein
VSKLLVPNLGKINNLIFFITFLCIAKFVFISKDLVNFRVSEIGTSYFGAAYPQTLFQNTNLWQFAASLIYVSLINLAGVWCLSVLLNNRLLEKVREFGYFFFLGFIPGYLLNIALLRLLSYFLGARFASVLTTICLVLFALMSRKTFDNSSVSYTLVNSLRKCLFVTVSLTVFMITQIQGATHHVIGDSAIKTISQLQYIVSTDKFPLIAKHYDELATLLPLRLLFPSENVNVLPFFWILYAFGKCSLFISAYVGIKIATKNSRLSLYLTSYIFFAYLTINPLSNPLLFDSENPLATNLHIGRIVIICSAIFYLCMRIADEKLLSTSIPSPLALAIISTLTIGSTALTGSWLFVILGLIFFNCIWRAKLPSKLTPALVICILATETFLLPLLDSNDSSYAGLALLFFAAINCCLFLLPSFSTILKSAFGHKIIFLNIFLSLFIGYTIFGNILAIKFREILKIDTTGILPGDIPIAMNQLGRSSFVGVFPLTHNMSYESFIRYFGILTVLTMLALALIRYQSMRQSDLDTVSIVIFFVTIYCVTFFVWDFLNGGVTANDGSLSIWVKSRFLEPWFYCGIIIYLAMIYRMTANKLVEMAVIFLVTTSLVSSLPGGFLSQFFVNLKYIFFTLI